MINFLATLFAALIGAMLAPYFSDFLNQKKTKEAMTLKNLAEAYLLAKQINFYIYSIRNGLLFAIAVLKGQLKLENIPKQNSIEDPLPKLNILFDFHLNAPQEIIRSIETLEEGVISSSIIFAKAINSHNSSEQDRLFNEAAVEIEKWKEIAKNVEAKTVDWIKAEKNILLRTTSIKR